MILFQKGRKKHFLSDRFKIHQSLLKTVNILQPMKLNLNHILHILQSPFLVLHVKKNTHYQIVQNFLLSIREI